MLEQESVELPLTHPEYYEEMGIKPPKGVILYGAPGTGRISLLYTASSFSRLQFGLCCRLCVYIVILVYCTDATKTVALKTKTPGLKTNIKTVGPKTVKILP